MTTDVEAYFLEGCGRCSLGGTPDCKVHRWTFVLKELRRILLFCGLEEVSKWGAPCYMLNGKNVLLLVAFKDFASLNFFKGSLMKDESNLLELPGPNSQAFRFMKFTDTKTVLDQEKIIKAYLYEAIEIEKARLEVNFKKEPEPIPQELKMTLQADPNLENAFYSLTPGRQRGYILHFSQPKKSQTRLSRIEKCISKVLEGKGFHDQ